MSALSQLSIDPTVSIRSKGVKPQYDARITPLPPSAHYTTRFTFDRIDSTMPLVLYYAITVFDNVINVMVIQLSLMSFL